MNWLQILSITTAVAAAIFWFLSAVVRTPKSFAVHVVRAEGPMGQPMGGPVGGTYVGQAYSNDFLELASALKRQSRLSALAAVFAGVSAGLQAASM